MLLPFTDYLQSIMAHKHECVSLFERYQKNKPPFAKDKVKQVWPLRKDEPNQSQQKKGSVAKLDFL